ncbi:predicted protein [Postia placenta Mad-698-R]|uniref:Uncharacterized protein n=1 Tax=Postia placenta MAD-698-R-SB12 TaxID=670580 RepID=A0A1X6N1P6_9APHY|nr:hypothetical protein POSPLADRAFT_1140967 [Postia placenta MAD-698-R-SB12]EED79089.1 predicted protein [Postia placenta Mad-698-R]OSX62537.1 hypothetical protein POSPLADRAFT_1140967 [Postia placenta MAD-698-R-SB12]
MCSFNFYAVFAALLVAPALVGARVPVTRTSMRETAANPAAVGLAPLALAHRTPLTNAQRLARGLTPNRPRFNRAGTIQVTGAGTGTPAFISRVPNAFGEYAVTTDTADALIVQYTDCADASVIDLATLNGIADVPYLGAITGFATALQDLRRGSSAYAYIGGTDQTAPGATPQAVSNSFMAATGDQEEAESALWTLNRTTGALSAQWVNIDGSKPETIIVYSPENFLVITGDPTIFGASFGTSPVVTLTFVAA